MARKRTFGFAGIFVKPKKKNKGIHSKNRHTSNKNGKYYTGTKNGCKRYRGQGR
jgi:hypothetical protein|tara:strand:- start:256 stop:417 length:162 start_codon:yes stop_codon:yes gene_type:complete